MVCALNVLSAPCLCDACALCRLPCCDYALQGTQVAHPLALGWYAPLMAELV
jgi:transposase